MRVLFCHDGPIRKDDHNDFYGIAHNDETFERYYSIADEIAVVIRVQDISSSEAYKKLSKITVNPFEVISVPNISSVKGQFKFKKEAIKIIDKEIQKSDYIVARLPSFIGNIAVDLAKKHHKPYLVEVVGYAWDGYWNHSIKGKFVAPIMNYKTKLRVKEAPYVVYVTNNFLQNKYPTNGKSTNCSNVSLTDFNDKVLERRIKKIELMNGTDKVILGTTAAVNVKYKGQQYIIQALGELKKSGITNYEYQLVGDGDQTFLRSIAKKYGVLNQVKFLGAMPHKEVFNWLETIDIYVQPSRQEGLPRALIEAMSKALPAIGANTAGIPELLNKKFIFSNTHNNIKEILNILNGFNKNTMLEQAKENYQESKKYEKEIIEKRRKKFFRAFKNSQSKI
ncbi:glycosyltransferase [Facklamia sp. P12945]|uniref:glycosyltransferase n=1 Tax=Facklamia sp. P12945 TaxID=3421950 RepID=UPI003D1819E4